MAVSAVFAALGAGDASAWVVARGGYHPYHPYHPYYRSVPVPYYHPSGAFVGGLVGGAVAGAAVAAAAAPRYSYPAYGYPPYCGYAPYPPCPPPY